MQENLLPLLLKKWQYHDAQIYRFLPTALGVQAAVTSAAAIVVSRVGLTKPSAVALVLAFGMAAFITWQWREMSRIARRVRNTFNREIVEGLRKDRLLADDDTLWNNRRWSADDDEHPINLWHTPTPGGRGAGTRASATAETEFALLCLFDLVVVLGLIGWAIARGCSS